MTKEVCIAHLILQTLDRVVHAETASSHGSGLYTGARASIACRITCSVSATLAADTRMLHAGIQLGLFGDAGTRTCGGAAASYGHEELDAQTFASWGISYLKYDNCFAVKKDK